MRTYLMLCIFVGLMAGYSYQAEASQCKKIIESKGERIVTAIDCTKCRTHAAAVSLVFADQVKVKCEKVKKGVSFP